MVYIQTLKDVSCTIQGDEITKDGDSFIIKKDGKIFGVFDEGVVAFMYLTHPREEKKNG